MEVTKHLKRLFVGGLHHTVSENEIKERFSTFGAVTDVDLVFRKDNEGNPIKTFGYININASERELKQCISILNKSKWKGETLQVELAKECFLHKLAQERQVVAKNQFKQQVNNTTKVVESLKKAGVENFNIRSAVPGTEIPEHKDWVVSKFGRVLPILHLRKNGQKKIIKYDPSKYCHNIKKLDHVTNSEVTTPVTNLTWHLEETDDEEIRKKKRGDFPAPTQPAKRKKLSVSKYHVVDSNDSDSNFTANMSSYAVEDNGKSGSNKDRFIAVTENKFAFSKLPCSINRNLGRQETNASSKSNTWSKAQIACHHSGFEEQELISERENNKTEELSQAEHKLRDMPLEVVGEDYVLRHQTHWALNDLRKEILEDVNSGSEYDSADTDEIISGKMISHKSLPRTKFSEKRNPLISNTEGDPKKKECNSNSNSSNEDSEAESSESNLDSDYEEMMNSCYRIDLSLTDLEQLANSSSKAKKENNKLQSDLKLVKNISLQPSLINPLPSASGTKISQSMPALKKNTILNKIASAIQDEDSSDCEITPNKQLINPSPSKKTMSLFKSKEENSKGDKLISDQLFLKVKRKMYKESDSDSETSAVDKKQKVNQTKNVVSSDSDSDEKSNFKPPPFKGTKFLQFNTPTMTIPSHKPNFGISENKTEKLKSVIQNLCNSELLNGERCGDCGDANEAVNAVKQKMVHFKQTELPKFEASTLLVVETSHVKEERECKAGIDKDVRNTARSLAAGTPRNSEKYLLDNQKRLAALHERQKETEMQKKLIQGALTNLDNQKPDKGKHIVFDFEEESENNALFKDVGENFKEEDTKSQGKLHVEKAFENRTIGKLFDSEEDNEDDSDEDYNGRFKLKPQFEGKAGHKLFDLQSRFGTDERFRMDERFLESEDENTEESVMDKGQSSEDEEFADEKKRALNILQSVIQFDGEKSDLRKEQTRFKKFKDVSALRYDPTKEDHIGFESKLDDSTKKSKKEKRKAKEEAEKLPEVSTEIYYDVNVDLKEMFDSGTKVNEVKWDMKDDSQVQDQPIESPETVDCLLNGNSKEDLAGFTFSFFDDATSNTQKPELGYQIESRHMTAFPWQEDPRFQDSSSEDDNDEEKDLENCGNSTEKTEVIFSKKNANLFFFFKDDQRLKDGPKLFCRTTDLEEEKHIWEEKRTLLIETPNLPGVTLEQASFLKAPDNPGNTGGGEAAPEW
ncbi:nucleolar protein 8 isoform X2 [Chiloscyllium plagiosum]|uniref:nucleolar protein 8 isoform X2 n=1 Tax=Chiloscyllium plagiosum TaxID=36176 RepID=UPI001CB838CB|nr:nucleolar protein 8 isoform X2 [Chiloscyllium plagiosum]